MFYFFVSLINMSNIEKNFKQAGIELVEKLGLVKKLNTSWGRAQQSLGIIKQTGIVLI